MATLRKTFLDGAVLPASDLNDALNPTTADHVPYATSAGSVTCSATSTGVIFPPGRFSATPIIELSIDSTNLKLVARPINRTTNGFSVYLGNSDSTALTGSHTILWTATQMTPANGAG